MGIIYWNLLVRGGVSEQNTVKKISMRQYTDITVYDCFNNTFPVYGVSKDLNKPPIPIDDSPRPNKISRQTSDTLPYDIPVTSGNSVSKLSTPYDPPQVLVLNYDNPDTQHTITSDNAFRGRATIGY